MEHAHVVPYRQYAPMTPRPAAGLCNQTADSDQGCRVEGHRLEPGEARLEGEA